MRLILGYTIKAIEAISFVIGCFAWGYFFIHMLEKVGEKTDKYFISIIIVAIIMLSMVHAAEFILELE